ncbi:MAG: ribonuclease HI [Chloroflexota bacterium]
MIIEDALNIFTDGSSLQSPRAGGIGIRYITIDSSGDELIQDIQSPGYKNATNNQMELQACIFALSEAVRLKMLLGLNRVVVYSDSQYLVENYKKAMFRWPKKQWCLESGRPVLNADLWKQLVKNIKKTGVIVDFKWVKGHSKNVHNRAADKMARGSAKFAFNKPLSLVHVRRKLSSESVDIGSVDMLGQRISIRIITSEYLKVQQISKYKYEVISEKSKYKWNVDIIFSEHNMEVGHSYYVRVNDETSNPRVEKIFKEL